MNDVPPPLPSLAPSIPETVVGWGHVEGRTGGVGCQETPQILQGGESEMTSGLVQYNL